MSEVVQTLRAAGLTAEEAEEIRRQNEPLYKERRITREQVRKIREQLPPPGNPHSEEQRTRQLEALAELRRIGALSESEFRAEKTRILKPPPSS